MIRAVLDTNVVVAAMLSRHGASNRLLRLVGDGRWKIAISVPLALEYERSLRRLCGDPAAETLLSFLLANASLRRIFFLWRPMLPDPDDHFVLEVAMESRADFMVTFNRRDLQEAERFGIQVIPPSEFLAILEKEI